MLAVHGGAGGPQRARLGETAAGVRLSIVREALEAGMSALRRSDDPLEAVTAAVVVLEDAAELNAGRGCALTSHASVELSAAVADGSTGAFAGVAGLSRTRNPVLLARRLAAQHREVLLIGPAADDLAEEWGLAVAPPEYFMTPERLQAVRDARSTPLAQEGSKGTVGAVARSTSGLLASATSTGGISGQRPGRVGDSPICGAGTWADARTCALSATGEGEAFVRSAFAHDVHARMLYKGEPLAEACEHSLCSIGAVGASGGCIALSARGELAMPFNTGAMLRGWMSTNGRWQAGIDPGEFKG